MLNPKSRIRSPMFLGALLAALAMSSGLALADSERHIGQKSSESPHSVGKKSGEGPHSVGQNLGGGPHNIGNGSSGSGPVAVPEIDVGAGGNALALLVGGVLLAAERMRSLGKGVDPTALSQAAISRPALATLAFGSRYRQWMALLMPKGGRSTFDI